MVLQQLILPIIIVITSVDNSSFVVVRKTVYKQKGLVFLRGLVLKSGDEVLSRPDGYRDYPCTLDMDEFAGGAARRGGFGERSKNKKASYFYEALC